MPFKKHKSDILKVDVLQSSIYTALAEYIDPYLGTDLVAANCIKEVIINSCQVTVNVQYNFLLGKYLEKLINKLRNILEPIIFKLTKDVGVKLNLEINCLDQILTHAYKKNIEKVHNIKRY